MAVPKSLLTEFAPQHYLRFVHETIYTCPIFLVRLETNEGFGRKMSSPVSSIILTCL